MEKRAEELICKVVDGLASPEENEELEALMAKHPDLKEELDNQRNLGSALECVGVRELQDDIADQYWGNVYNRLERKTGWVLTIIGVAILAGFGLYQLETDPAIHHAYKIGVAVLVIGLVLVFAGVLKMRLKMHKKDKYSGVIR